MAPKDGRKNPLMHLVAGGVAGVVESSCCHPLDTIKTRMQLRTKGGSTKGPLRTASGIVSKEGFFALYKGLSAVMMGIAPKMAVRFTSFETYKEWLGATPTGNKGVCGCDMRAPVCVSADDAGARFVDHCCTHVCKYIHSTHTLCTPATAQSSLPRCR